MNINKLILSAILLPSFAFAADELPLLSKVTETGKVAAGYNKSIECTIYQSKVKLRYTAGFAAVVHEKPISFGGGINFMLSDAKSAILKRNVVRTDSETITYQAFMLNDYGKQETIELGTSVKGTWAIENPSVGANGFRYLLDKLCK
ncbi:hypothetical protein QEJ31_10425 [Pigmentibacter sp. JX0631]|uniref:hypothetical protein n=1 Tax=Pigmentibacter sp. JX0631 TaxID=2976982 RepID=UPI0024699A9B|nr:hypothetical protein [Pigmentibacter sp. JX0631]WGL58936.1 hypothetical protein QEJ31_10425 [Pigmentibacter sp. JX0631]